MDGDDKKKLTLEEAEEEIAKRYGIPKSVYSRMITQESGGRTDAVSPKGAKTRWQIMPGTARQLGYDPKDLDADPLKAAEAGLRYLRDNYKQVRQYAKNEKHAWMASVGAYHAGPGAVLEDFKKGGYGLPLTSDGAITTRDHVLKIFDGLSSDTLDRSPNGPISAGIKAASALPGGENAPQVKVNVAGPSKESGATPEEQAAWDARFGAAKPPRVGQILQKAVADLVGGSQPPPTNPNQAFTGKIKFDGYDEAGDQSGVPEGSRRMTDREGVSYIATPGEGDKWKLLPEGADKLPDPLVMAELASIGESAAKGEKDTFAEDRKKFTDWLAQNKLPETKESVDRYNAEQKAGYDKKNEAAKAESLKKFRAQKGYSEYKKFVDNSGGKFEEGTPESLEAYNAFAKAKAAGNIRGKVEATIVGDEPAEKKVFEFDRTGTVTFSDGSKRTVDASAEAPEGKVRFRDEEGETYLFDRDTEQWEDESLKQLAVRVPIMRIPREFRTTMPPDEAKKWRAREAAAGLAQRYPGIDAADAESWLMHRGFTDIDTGGELPTERYFQSAEDVQKRFRPKTSIGAPGSPRSEAEPDDFHEMTRRDVRDLEAYVSEARRQREDAALKAIAAGEELSPEALRAMRLDPAKFASQRYDDIQMAREKGRVVKADLERIFPEMLKEAGGDGYRANLLGRVRLGVIPRETAQKELAAYDSLIAEKYGPSGGRMAAGALRTQGRTETEAQTVRTAIEGDARLYARNMIARYGSAASALAAKEKEERDERERKSRIANADWGTYLKESAKSATIGSVRTFGGAVADAVKGTVAYTKPQADILDAIFGTQASKVTEHPIYKAADDFQKALNEWLPGSDYDQEFAQGKLPQTIAGSLPIILPSLVMKDPKTVIGLLASLQMGGSGFNEALAAGASEEDALKFGLLSGTLFGWTETLGMANSLSRIFNGTGGTTFRQILRETAKNAPREISEEVFLNEGPQTVGQNILAKIIFDPTREWDKGLAENLLLAGASAGVISTAATAVNTIRNSAEIKRQLQRDAASGGPFIRNFGDSGLYVHGKQVKIGPALDPLVKRHAKTQADIEEAQQTLGDVARSTNMTAAQKLRSFRDINGELRRLVAYQEETAKAIEKAAGVPKPDVLEAKAAFDDASAEANPGTFEPVEGAAQVPAQGPGSPSAKAVPEGGATQAEVAEPDIQDEKTPISQPPPPVEQETVLPADAPAVSSPTVEDVTQSKTGRALAVAKQAQERAGRERRRADEATIKAFTNDLTRLGNKNAWEAAKNRIESDPEQEVISFDVNRMKDANDTTSHSVVDQKVLAPLGKVIADVLEQNGVPVRNAFTPGGDEAYVAVPKGKAEQIRDEIERAFGVVELTATKDYTNSRTGESFKTGDVIPVTLSGEFGQTVDEAETGLAERKETSKKANPIRRTATPPVTGKRTRNIIEPPKTPAIAEPQTPLEKFEARKLTHLGYSPADLAGLHPADKEKILKNRIPRKDFFRKTEKIIKPVAVEKPFYVDISRSVRARLRKKNTVRRLHKMGYAFTIEPNRVKITGLPPRATEAATAGNFEMLVYNTDEERRAKIGKGNIANLKSLKNNASLSQFVRASGGLRPSKYNKGEARRLSKKESGKSGLINQNALYTAEEMAVYAWESGYLRDHFPDVQDVNPDEFLSLLEDDLARPTYFPVFGGTLADEGADYVERQTQQLLKKEAVYRIVEALSPEEFRNTGTIARIMSDDEVWPILETAEFSRTVSANERAIFIQRSTVGYGLTESEAERALEAILAAFKGRLAGEEITGDGPEAVDERDLISGFGSAWDPFADESIFRDEDLIEPESEEIGLELPIPTFVPPDGEALTEEELERLAIAEEGSTMTPQKAQEEPVNGLYKTFQPFKGFGSAPKKSLREIFATENAHIGEILAFIENYEGDQFEEIQKVKAAVDNLKKERSAIKGQKKDAKEARKAIDAQIEKIRSETLVPMEVEREKLIEDFWADLTEILRERAIEKGYAEDVVDEEIEGGGFMEFAGPFLTDGRYMESAFGKATLQRYADDLIEEYFEGIGASAETDVEATPDKKPDREFSSTQVNFNESDAVVIKDLAAEIIDAEDLYAPEGGFEDTPHITVKYGIHSADAKSVRDAIEAHSPVVVALGKTKVFDSNPDYDVVVVEVQSEGLHALNADVAGATKVTDTFPTYEPHVTLAYVKKGTGKKYAGKDSFVGEEFSFDAVVFSSKDRSETNIPLSAKVPQPAEGGSEIGSLLRDPEAYRKAYNEDPSAFGFKARLSSPPDIDESMAGPPATPEEATRLENIEIPPELTAVMTPEEIADLERRAREYQESVREKPQEAEQPKPTKKRPKPTSEKIAAPESVEPDVKAKPIRQLGTGADVYFETPKYRVNERKGKFLLITHDSSDNPFPSANIAFDTAEEAVAIAKRLAEQYPDGHPEALLIEKVVEGWRTDLADDTKPKQYTKEQLSAMTAEQVLKIWDSMFLGAAPGRMAAEAQILGAEAPTEPTFGAKNTIFTEDKAEAARKLLREKLRGNQHNIGLDPEIAQAGLQLAGYYIEGGARKFADYARRMLEDLGDEVRPYLKSWYFAVQFDPAASKFAGEMDDMATVDAAIEELAKPAAAEKPAIDDEGLATDDDLKGDLANFRPSRVKKPMVSSRISHGENLTGEGPPSPTILPETPLEPEEIKILRRIADAGKDGLALNTLTPVELSTIYPFYRRLITNVTSTHVALLPKSERKIAWPPAEAESEVGRPDIERGRYTWKKNSQNLWAWFADGKQKSGAYPKYRDADYAFNASSLKDAETEAEAAPPLSIKDHPEYERLDRVYGGLSQEQVDAKLAEMEADIARHAKVAKREFNEQGGRRSSAAVSAQAVRDIGEEKLLLGSYRSEKFGETRPADKPTEPIRPSLEDLRGTRGEQAGLFGAGDTGLFGEQQAMDEAVAKPDTYKADTIEELRQNDTEAQQAANVDVFGEDVGGNLNVLVAATNLAKQTSRAAADVQSRRSDLSRAGEAGLGLAADVVAALEESGEAEMRAMPFDDYIRQSWIGREPLSGRAREFYDAVAKGRFRDKFNKEVDSLNAERTDKDLERDSESGPEADQAGLAPRDDGDAGPGRTEPPARGEDGEPGGSRLRPERGTGLYGDSPTPVLEGGDQPVREPAPDSQREFTGDFRPETGARSGDAGSLFDEETGLEIGGTAAKRRLLEREKRAAQTRAESVDVRLGDLPNIRETLPFLLLEQQEDVHFIENRFAQGPGVLITNGTGTGKTYTGLGAIKRFHKQGKENILLVAPNDKILEDWGIAAENLHLNIKRLKSTLDNGRAGIVSTTYANFRANKELLEREWDLIVFDEAHNLSQNKDGDETAAVHALRANALHPRGEFSYDQAKNFEIYAEQSEKSAQIQRVMKKLRRAWNRDERALLRTDLNRLQEDFRKFSQEVVTPASEAARAEFQAKIADGKRPNVLFLSATPFAYEKSIEYAEGFLFDYGPEPTSGGYNSGDAKQRFMMQHFGYRMRYNKLTRPDADVNTEMMEIEFNSMLQKTGALRGRKLEADVDYSRQFVLTESAIGNKIDDGFSYLWSQARRNDIDKKEKSQWYRLAEMVDKRWSYLSKRFTLEAINAKSAIPLVKQHLDLGRKVVVFHDYNKNESIHPFNFDEYFESEAAQILQAPLYAVYEQFREARPDIVDMDLSDLEAPIDVFRREFGEAVGFFNGRENTKDRRAAVRDFNDDDGKLRIFVAQSAAGREGISLHDTSGTFQRVLINLGLPERPIAAIQTEGRIYRVGTRTNAIQLYLSTGTNFEREAFATRIAQRASTAENLAMGEEARALRQAFIDGYGEADPEYRAHEREGTGGKEADQAMQRLITEFERAKGFYFGKGKKTSRNKSAEGKDYFATPEPLGLKMVEWADQRFLESALEPSAGHGAIARWFRADNHKLTVEPSWELASKLALVTDARVEKIEFENLSSRANKADTIVMNPPFGSGGSTAVKHLAKAAKHLNNKGRIVALLPTGPAADKALDKFLESEEAKHLYKTADIQLPPVTFKRAATEVRTHIVILDKEMLPGDVDKLPQQVTRDYSQFENINDLFDAIENVEMPKRTKPDDTTFEEPDTSPSTETAAEDLTTATIPEREELIEQIVEAYRSKQGTPEIVEVLELEGNDGKWYSPFGVPPGLGITGNKRVKGYAYSGGRYGSFAVGNISPTREALLEEAEAGRDKALAEFRDDLEKQNDEKIRLQADHWLDGYSITAVDPPVKSRSGTTSDGDWLVTYTETGKYSGRKEAKRQRFWRKGDAQDWIAANFAAPATPSNDVGRSARGGETAAMLRDEFTHTRDGHTVYVAKLKDQVPREEFSRLRSLASAHGGYYSNYSKGGAIPGFHFKSTESRDKFANEAEGGGMLQSVTSPMPATAQTETPEFKRWFGDSKVVDENGEPLVVYHGTRSTDIEQFLPHDREGKLSTEVVEFFRKKKAANEGIGYFDFRSGSFFSPDPQYAENYTGENRGVVYPVYLKAENPIYFDAVTGKVTGTDKTKTADALIITDGEGGINEIAVLDPTQVKSAIGNRGTFDPSNPSILQKVRDAESNKLLTETLPQAHTQDVLDGIESRVEDEALFINEHASEQVRRLYSELQFRFYGRETEVKPSDAAVWGYGELMSLVNLGREMRVDYLAAGYTEDQLKLYDGLLDNLEELAVRSDDYGVLYTFDDALPEEFVHQEDLRAGRTDAEALDTLRESPLWNNPGAVFERDYPSLSSADKASELAAKLATGQETKYGWGVIENFEQVKAEFLRTWADGIVRNNRSFIESQGIDAFVEKFRRIAEYATITTADAGRSSKEEGGRSPDGTRSGSSEEGRADGEKPSRRARKRKKSRTDRPAQKKAIKDEGDEAKAGRTSRAKVRKNHRQYAQTLRDNNREVADVPYVPGSDAERIEEAKAIIADSIAAADASGFMQGDYDQAVERFNSENIEGRTKTVLGIALIDHLGSTGDLAQMNRIADATVIHVGEAAQALQASTIVSKYDFAKGVMLAQKALQKHGKTLTQKDVDKLKQMTSLYANSEKELAMVTKMLADAEDIIRELEARNAEIVEALNESALGLETSKAEAEALGTALEESMVESEEKTGLIENLKRQLGYWKDKALKEQLPGVRVSSTYKKLLAEKPFIMDALAKAFPGRPLGSVTGRESDPGWRDRKAPNGYPSLLPKHLYEMVRTPEFKAWFGDWENDPANASKILDANGEPLLVYHGTPRGDFAAFDELRFGTNIDSGWLGKGTYFTNLPFVANYYAKTHDEKAPTVYFGFLNIRSPFDWGPKTHGVRGMTFWNQKLPADLHDAVVRRTGFKEEYARIWDEQQLSEELTKELIERGHDGVTTRSADGREIVAFRPNQFKSAFNRGAFGPTDNMLQSVTAPHFDDEKRELLTKYAALQIFEGESFEDVIRQLSDLTAGVLTAAEVAQIHADGEAMTHGEPRPRSEEAIAKQKNRQEHARQAREFREGGIAATQAGNAARRAGKRKHGPFLNALDRQMLVDAGNNEQLGAAAVFFDKAESVTDWFKFMKSAYPELGEPELRDLFVQAKQLRDGARRTLQAERAANAGHIKDARRDFQDFRDRQLLADALRRRHKATLDQLYRQYTRGVGQKAVAAGEQAIGVMKGLSAMGEMSTWLRQNGLLFLTHPVKTTQALEGSYRGALSVAKGAQANLTKDTSIGNVIDELGIRSEVQLLAYMARLRNHPYFTDAQAHHLEFANIGDFNIADEHFVTRVFDAAAEARTKNAGVEFALTPVRIFGKLYKMQEIANTLFGDAARLHTYAVYAEYVDSLPGMTGAERSKAKRYAADAVNAFGGRGDVRGVLGSNGVMTKLANSAFFSLRLLLSRPQSVWRLSTGFALAPKGMRVQMLSEGLKFYSFVTLLLMLAGLRLDPWDKDFGKVKSRFKALPDYNFDLLAGTADPLHWVFGIAAGMVRQIGAMARGEDSDILKYNFEKLFEKYWYNADAAKSDDSWLSGLRYWRGKASPAVSLGFDFFSGKDFIGRPFNWKNALASRLIPLSYTQTYQALFYDRHASTMKEPDLAQGELDVLNGLVTLGATGVGIGVTQYPNDDQTEAESMAWEMWEPFPDSGKRSAEEKRIQKGLRALFRMRKQQLAAGEDVQAVSKAIDKFANLYSVDEGTLRRLQKQGEDPDFTFVTQRFSAVQVEKILSVATDAERSELEAILKAKATREQKKEEAPVRSIGTRLHTATIESAINLYNEESGRMTSEQRYDFRRRLRLKVLDAHSDRRLSREDFDAAKAILGDEIKFEFKEPVKRKPPPAARGPKSLQELY